MSKTDAYFQFPLCALTYAEGDAKTCLNALISYGLVEASKRLWAGLDEHEQEEVLNGERFKLPEGFDRKNWAHGALVYGASVLNITPRGLSECFERHRRVADHRRKYEQVHGVDAEVRISADFVFEARDGTGMTFREFTVLCAIYSTIGDKSYAAITRSMIQARSAGYKSEKVMKETRGGKKNALTDWQIRDTVDRLHQRGFFARCRPNCRQAFFSHRLTDDQLMEVVLKLKTQSAKVVFKREQAEKDKALMAQIVANRTGALPKQVPAPAQSPPETPATGLSFAQLRESLTQGT